MDIGSIVSERLAAIRKLRENPNDVSALNAMHRAQNEVKKRQDIDCHEIAYHFHTYMNYPFTIL